MIETSTKHATFTIERTYAASPPRVFAAWADPRAKSEWFAGPGGWQPIEREFDFRVGGQERVSGRFPDGTISAFNSHYHDIVPDRRIIFSYGMHINGERISVSLTTVELRPYEDGTRLVLTEQGAFFDGYDDSGSREQGTHGLLDALASALRNELTITRVIDAPRERVFRAWTDPAEVAQWWGPYTYTAPVCQLDVKPGGSIRIDMRSPEGLVHVCRGTYREVVAPERLVYTLAAEDTEGNQLFDVLQTITFADRGGKTELTVHAKVLTANPGAEPMLDGAEKGWGQTLERLAEFTSARSSEGVRA